jgi:diguanylate cyclase (GGDEF)-like protein/PAS domain S-box-containing protein
MKDDHKTKKQLVDELTALRLQNAALKESKGPEKYRSLIENLRDVVYELDSQGVVLYISPTIKDLLGYDSTEIVGKNFIELAHKDDLSSQVKWFSELRKGVESPSEYRIINKSGEYRWAQMRTRPITEDGQFKGARGILIDVTEQKRAEETLRESEEKYRSTFENSIMGIVQTLRDGRLIDVNNAYAKMFGYANAEEMMTKVSSVGPLYANPEEREDVLRILTEKGVMEPREITVIRRDGTRFTVLVGTREIRDFQGNLLYYQAEQIDITKRKQVEGALRESEEKYRTVADFTYDWEYWLASDGKYIYVSPSCERISGYRAEEFQQDQNLLEKITHPDDKHLLAVHINDVLQGKFDVYELEFRIVTKNNEECWIGHTCQAVYDRDGTYLGQRGSNRDITERKKSEETLRLSEERFRRIFDEGPFGMGLESPDQTIIAANEVLCELLGYTEQELAGQNIADVTYEEDREKSKELLGQLFANSTPVFRLEKRYVRKDGTILWANTTISAIHGQEGNVLYGLAIIEDITESRTAAEKIRLLAYYDSLTGLPNRTFHKELVKRSIEHAHRHKEIFALIYIGLDNLKRINDTLGYGIGDLLLKAVADRLTYALRKSDYVARLNVDEHETVNVLSRVGGDEFMVLVHDLNQAQDVARTSRRLLEELSAPYDLGGQEVFITVSIGIALYPDDGTDVDDLLKNAEKAMRHTKNEGKNNFHFYSKSMHSSVSELLTLENDLHRALERNELVLYYQPKVDAATRMVKGMEALIRWNHPDRGLIPPMQFIPIAETSGLILPIGEFVIRTVCGQIKTWQEAGYQQVNIALNVSGRQFDQQNLIEIVQEALQDSMIFPQCLEVEITESTIMRNPEKAVQILTDLKAIGLRIAIDDFGTGYSSLSYLKQLPLDFLKIDQSFVKGVASDPKDQAIIRTIIAMAHSLNLKTIAEGVETEEQLSFLQEHGCDEIQGYLFSRPLPAEEIQGILAKGFL